jgi:hypothetical protein
MNKTTLTIGAMLLMGASIGMAQTSAKLDGGKFVSHEETTVQRLNCKGTAVQFARGVRWTPADYSPVLSINDKTTVSLPKSCYTQMMCVVYNSKPSVLIVDAPACGGNAVGEDYIVIELATRRKHVLNYAQARKAGLINF